MREGYSTQFVCQSVSQSLSYSATRQEADLEYGWLLKIETSIKEFFVLADFFFRNKLCLILGCTIASDCW